MNLLSEQLCDTLAYLGEDGFLPKNRFPDARGVAHTLDVAARSANVVASFGVWEQSTLGLAARRFVPLVYLAEADSVVQARNIHRWVWSQGLAPLLLIVTPESIYRCEGFNFSGHGDWEHSRPVRAITHDAFENGPPKLLRDLTAQRLKSSIAWRDFAQDSESRVDQSLLRGLKSLHKQIYRIEAGKLLSAVQINQLIGRLIYLFVLIDRGILPKAWLQSILGIDQPFSRERPISIDAFWELQDAIDDLFNGSIFQISGDRSLIDQEVLDLAINILRHGAIDIGGALQTSLIDIDLSALQVETLSAVYEQFLTTESPELAKQDGVVYTPPFLVDFVMNRLEDIYTFSSSSKVIDPTAGSGVFLVAAYRRIIEQRLLEEGKNFLPLSELRSILLNSIHGIEKNESAARVAAFSLYLNIIEYADAAEIASAFQSKPVERIFPKLLSGPIPNILVADFFSCQKHFSDRTFDIAVGNPPWKTISEVTGAKVDRKPIDHDEAAEQVVWDIFNQYLEPDGLGAFVMPAKSFASPSAVRFAPEFCAKYHIVGTVNLSHWRRYLFSGAEQPAALMFARKAAPSARSRTWFYAPQLWTQPFKPSAMWTIAIDQADSHTLPTRLAFRNSQAVFDSFALKPIDRAVKSRLELDPDRQRSSFGDVLKKLGLKIGRGGSPNQTGIAAKYICAAKDFSSNGRRERGSSAGTFSILEAKACRKLPDSAMGGCHSSFERKFNGPRLILARSMASCHLLDFPMAVNSTFNVIYFASDEQPNLSVSERHRVLEKIGCYLMSNLQRYWMALYGKLWQTDRTRFERKDLLDTPCPDVGYFMVPIHELDHEPYLSHQALELMGAGDLIDAFQDYLTNRQGSENGVVDRSIYSQQHEVPDIYLSALKSSLVGSLGMNNVEVRRGSVSPSGLEIVIRLHGNHYRHHRVNYKRSNVFQFYNSTEIEQSLNENELLIRKPAERGYFTVERAYSDAIKIVNELLVA